jgi:hypothetical protein
VHIIAPFAKGTNRQFLKFSLVITRKKKRKKCTAQHSTAQHSTAQHSTAQHSALSTQHKLLRSSGPAV